jgi:hypothetical protein
VKEEFLMSDVALPVPTEVPPVVQRLRDAINEHDLERVVDCFAEDYRNETPVHPSRSFVGAEQVRRNWTQILGGLPDLRAELVHWAAAHRGLSSFATIRADAFPPPTAASASASPGRHDTARPLATCDRKPA